MATDNLQITLNAETSFEFELSVKGIDIAEAVVRFGLEKSGVTLQFVCKRESGSDDWNVVIPRLDKFGLKEGLYDHTIEVIANGYYFAPVKGKSEVAPGPEVTGEMVKRDVKVAISGIKIKEGTKKSFTKKQKPKKKSKKKDAPLKEVLKETMADKMISKLEPIDMGMPILPQLAGRKVVEVEEVELSEQEIKVRDLLKNVK